jgi:hypothetical protein
MVDSLCRITQWLASGLMSGSAVFIHDCRANERGLLHYCAVEETDRSNWTVMWAELASK